LGVYFGRPERFVDPETHTHNPIFFELAALNDLNEKVFGWHGRRYADFDFLSIHEDFNREEVERFLPLCRDLLQAEFGNAALIGLKDPRFCFVLPLWESALTQLGYRVKWVRVERSLDAVVASNERVNVDWTRAHNLRVATLSTLALEYFLGHRDAIRVSYDDALQNPKLAVHQLASGLGIDPDTAASAGAEGVLKKNLRKFDHVMLDLPVRARQICSGNMGVESSQNLYEELAEFLRENGLRLSGCEPEETATVVALKAKMDADAHQRNEAMLVTLREMDAEASMLTSSRGAPRGDSASLYWCNEASDTFDESRKVVLAIGQSAVGTRLVFRLPPSPQISRLRIDPSVHPGRFDLLELRINQATIEDFAERVGHVNQLRLANQGAGHVAIVAMNDDPYIELDVHDLAVDWSGGAAVEIYALRHALPNTGFDEIWSQIQGGVMAAIVGSQQEFAQGFQRSLDKAREVDTAEMRHQLLELSTSLNANIDALRHELRQTFFMRLVNKFGRR